MSQVAATQKTTLENFRGDFAGLAAFINRSWSENSEQPLQYQPHFLRSCFEYPGASSDLAPTIYCGTDPIAFVTAFPRTVNLEGKPLKIAIVTLLTVNPELKKKGYGVALWSELVSRLRTRGFDGMVNYCVSGSPMDQIIAGCCERLQIPTACVFSIGYISTLLTASDTFASVDNREEADTLVPSFLRASREVAHNSPFARVWSEAEARWQCEDRDAVVSATSEGVKGCGVLTGYIAPIANGKGTKCLFVEDVLWSELDGDERKRLLHTFLHKALHAGAEMATVPRCGYAELKTFSTASFIRTRRMMRVYLSLWNGMAVPQVFRRFI